MIHVGIDENGLGPRLGPLVVTAVTARVDTGDEARDALAPGRARGSLRTRLADSKKLVAHGDTALGEAWARALARRMKAPLSGGETTQGLVGFLSLDSLDELRTPCPRAHGGQCWDTGGDALVAGEELVLRIQKDLDRLAARGIEVLGAACVVACARKLNEGVDRGLSRFDMDLHAMERLILAARERAGCDVVATCGKVGGYDKYAPAFGPLAGRLHAVVAEGRARSEYSMPGVGRIAFVRDADDRHLIVAMASLVGKWVREVMMARVVRYHRSEHPDLPDASGYHDPVTAAFVDATALSRRRRKLPDECFERRALEPAPARRVPETTGATSRRPASRRPSQSSRRASA
jgi:ribonuclease HII